MFINLVTRVAIVLAMAAPVAAQTELAGSWAARNHEDGLERGGGPYAVDYTGLPLNDEARAKALSYSADQLGMIEHQCGMWPPFYLVTGPFGMKIWNEIDPVTGTTIALKIGAWEDKALQTIWMDGRPHPSKNAPHDQTGFTTGVWNGNELIATTTHLKTGYMRRNGAATSDQATITTHFRRHGDLLTLTLFMDDPVYLTEPYILTRSYNLATNPVAIGGPPCIVGDEGVESGRVPHYLPGKNPFTEEMTKYYGIPAEAAMGGAETMYPEYREKIKAKFVRPAKCAINCG
jgi:hypothetical protein